LTHQQVARDLLGLFCALQAAATLMLDLNRTHAANPLWLHHARFHVVWQSASTAALGAVELVLLFALGPLTPMRFYLVVVLAAVPVFGFFAALVTRRIYGGALSDPNGIKPLIIQRGHKTYRIDLNLVAEIGAVLTLLALMILFGKGV
jgi:hypothetical protein